MKSESVRALARRACRCVESQPEHRASGAQGPVAAGGASVRRARRRGRPGARQEHLDRLLPAHQPVRRGLRGPREQGRLSARARARGADRRRRAGRARCTRTSTDTVDELFLRTRKRSYLGVVRDGRIEIVAFRGRQGVPRMPGLGSEIRDSAHALAMGKVVLVAARARARSRGTWLAGLKSFTPHTITSPQQLTTELERVRRDGLRASIARSSTRTSAASPRRSSTSRALRRRARALDDASRVRQRARRTGGDRDRRRARSRGGGIPASRRLRLRRWARSPGGGVLNCKQMQKTRASCRELRANLGSTK